MNLLYCITAYPPSTGGAQTHFHELVRRLGKGNSCRVVCHWQENRTDWLRGVTVNAPADCEYTVDSVQVFQINLDPTDRKKLAFWTYAYYMAMHTAVRKISGALLKKMDQQIGSIDLVHAGRIGREFLVWAAFKLARRRQVPFVLTPFHHPRWTGWRYRSYLELYRQADAVMALTQAEKNVLIRLGVQARRIHVLGHAPVLSDLSPAPGYFGPGGPVILFLGQKYAYKGLDQLLQAMPGVWQQRPDARFAFIGPETDYSRQRFSSIKDTRVIVRDRVADQEKCAALADCTIFCLPSHQESFGGVFTEAWSFGKPVIGRNIPAVAEILSPGQDGELVGESPEELGKAILGILNDPDRGRQMGDRGKSKVQEKFNWDKLAFRQEEIYRQLLDVRPSSQG